MGKGVCGGSVSTHKYTYMFMCIYVHICVCMCVVDTSFCLLLCLSSHSFLLLKDNVIKLPKIFLKSSSYSRPHMQLVNTRIRHQRPAL